MKIIYQLIIDLPDDMGLFQRGLLEASLNQRILDFGQELEGYAGTEVWVKEILPPHLPAPESPR